jgi:excisionase family DNA binding protein
MGKTEHNSRVSADMEWMDIKSVQRYACISERTLREWLHRSIRPLPAVRVGNKILIRRSVFDAWLESHPLLAADRVDVSSTVDEMIADLGAAN